MNEPDADSPTPSWQLEFGFFDADLAAPTPEQESARAPIPEALAAEDHLQEPPPALSEEELTHQCRQWLTDLNLPGAAKLVRVHWNARLQSTAGFASYPSWRIELNPRLVAFDGQVQRTLKHELAHLIAYHQAGRRRIEPHGPEWRHACALLGIPGESARHTLPLPRRRVRRQIAYQCPSCGFVLHRVRVFRQTTACLRCCNAYNGGRYDARFKFHRLENPPPSE
ncbi:MAG: SprT-like domain-containing protein [Verrucomicrobiales bacterium]|nr:SprT-like domain-containing protein [Verrucomicrobiales bacterium]